MRLTVTVSILALAVLLLVACGGGESAPSRASPSTEAGGGEPTPAPTLADDCPISEPMEVRPDIGHGLGVGPVWMIATAAGEWESPDFLAKTIWIVDDAVQGEVRIRGRRLDNDDVARVQGYHEYDNDRVSQDGREIILGPPHGRSKDRRGYVIYPSAGCWRFTAESEGRVIAEITQYLYDVVP